MAKTMYDKLGDLLSETLEAGEVRFVRVPRRGANTSAAGNDGTTAGGTPENAGSSGDFSEQAKSHVHDGAGSVGGASFGADKMHQTHGSAPEANGGQAGHSDMADGSINNPGGTRRDTGKTGRPSAHTYRFTDFSSVHSGSDTEFQSERQGYVYKKLTEEIERCYRLLDIGVSASLDDVKAAYKAKLKYYHPDRHAGNEVLSKVATDKTRQVVEAYKKITGFLSE